MINKTLILLLVSITILIVQWIIFEVLSIVIIMVTLLLSLLIFTDNRHKNLYNEIKKFLLNDDNFENIIYMFFIIFWTYSFYIWKYNIYITIIWYLLFSLFLYIYIDSKEKNKRKAEKELNDFQNLLDTEYKKLQLKEEKNKSDEIIELEEIDEEGKDIYLDYIYELLEKKDYKNIINFHNKKYLSDYLIKTNNIEELSEYYLLVGASYQETWNLKLADKCFDIFLDNISLDSNTIKAFEKLWVEDIGVIKIMLLVKELQEIGLDYKMESEVYEKASKVDDKNKKRKTKK